MLQQYTSYLSEVGFYPADMAITRRYCGSSYNLDAALGKGSLWCYGVDKRYGIVVSDFVFDCDVSAPFAHSPFFSIGLSTYPTPKQRPQEILNKPSLFTYVGHDDVFMGEFKKGDIVRSVSISFLPDFYNDFIHIKYPKIFQNRKYVFPEIGNKDIIPGVVEVIHQIGSFHPSQNIARMYYDCKATELFSIIIQWEINNLSVSADNRVPESDLTNLHHVMEYLNVHYTEDIYLKTLARHAGMSQTKLTSLFRQVYGMTISDHIRNLRIHLAKEMLADDSWKIEAIANTVGYRFHGNFSTAFKDATGVTPRQYRKNLL